MYLSLSLSLYIYIYIYIHTHVNVQISGSAVYPHKGTTHANLSVVRPVPPLRVWISEGLTQANP